MRVFIDANQYISLFRGEPSGALTLLNDLENLLKEEEFVLVFPKITSNEVYRNIKGEIKNETTKLTLLSDIFPKRKMLRSIKLAERNLKHKYDLIIKERLEIKKNMAKKVFDLFQSALDLPDSPDVLKLAKERKIKRFPPGKESDPIGDQLAWELLLANCTDDDLIIVSKDGDWRDLTDPDNCKINPLILKEWNIKKDHKKIKLFNDLWGLIAEFKEGFKKPKAEIEKEKAENTAALRPTWFPGALSPSPSLSPSPWGTALGNISAYPRYFGPTGPSGPTSLSPSPSLSVNTPLSNLICSNCGRLLNEGGSYLVQNGLILCPSCAPWGF